MSLEQEKKLQDEQMMTPPPDQDPADVAFYIERLSKARDERSIPRKEFDGMTFEQDYERNRETAFSYLRPKKNDDDVRVNSGTSEKKIELMMNELLSMNFQPTIRSYDKANLEVVDLGADMTDMVRKTNEQENDEDMWGEVYQDLLIQRAAFVEELIVDEDTDNWFGGEAPVKSCAKKRRLSPLQVYPGDMFIPLTRFNEQPYIVVYDRMLYSEAKLIFQNNPNWKYVRKGANVHDEFIPWFKYRFSTLRADEVEVITYMSSAEHDNEYQQIVNGVMMHPKGTEMAIDHGYPIVGATGKAIPDFFYGKPPIASAKFLQALQDETLRNMIRKMRQAIEPPLGVANGKVYGRDVWSPGATTQGLTGSNFSKLIEHDGVTSSEFSMFQLITQKAEEFIGSANIQNQPGTGDMTATQIIELQKTSIKMLGQIVLAVVRLKRDATFLRLYSIFEEYLEPLEEEVDGDSVKRQYRHFEVSNGRTASGEIIHKFIVLLDKTLSQKDLYDVQEYEEQESKKKGKPVRYSFLNVDEMKAMSFMYHVEVTPEQRDSSSLDKVLFQDKLSQASQISQLTQKPLNADKLIADYETTWKTKGMFQSDAQSPEQTGGSVQEQANALLQKMGNPSVGGPPASQQASSALASMSSMKAPQPTQQPAQAQGIPMK
jgi:hypothetical protein